MRSLLLVICTVLVTSSCRDKIICSAFQSTYILDDSTRMAYYSYVWNLDKATRDQYISLLSGPADEPDSLMASDSLAVGGTTGRWETYYAHAAEFRTEVRDPRRSGFGIIRYEPMWLKNYKLKNAPMENVLAPKGEPAADEFQDIGDFVASDFSTDSLLTDDSLTVVDAPDSLLADSVEVAVQEEEVPETPQGPKFLYGYDPDDNFNEEQAYYNKYFGYLLIYKPPRKQEEHSPVPSDSTAVNTEIDPEVSDSTQVRERKGLFRNRKNNAVDTSENGGDQESTGNKEEEGGN